MKKLTLILLLFFTAQAKAELENVEVFPINTFGAYNSDDHPLTLSGGDSPDEQNMVTDAGPGLTGRLGFITKSTEVCTGNMYILPHSNGTRYFICQSGGNLKASQDGDEYTIQVSTVDASKITVGAVLGDRFYWANTTDGMWYTTFSGDTPTTVVVSTAMKVKYMASWKNRIWTAGLAGSERILQGSEYGDGTNFTLPADLNPAVTEPCALTISGALDEGISALYSSYQDTLVVMKPHSFGLLFGTHRDNFIYKKYSDQIGTAYPESIQDCDGVLRWLGPARTIYEFNGAQFRDIVNDPANGKRIYSLVSQASQGDAQDRTYTFTSADDFATGDLLYVSTVISSGNLKLSTWTVVDTSSADFAAGTLTNVSTTIVDGSLYLYYNNTDFSSNMSSTYWTYGTDWYYFGSQYANNDEATNGMYLKLLDSSDNVLVSQYYSPHNWGTTDYLEGLSSYRGRNVKFRITTVAGDPLTSQLFVCSGENIGVYAYTNGAMSVQFVTGGKSTVTNGNIISQTFDTSFSTPAWIPSTPTYTTNGGSVTFETQVSTDGATWGSLVALPTTTWTPASASERYIRYKVSMSTTASSTGLPYVSDVTIAARSSTGSWVTESIPTTGMSAHGIFQVGETLNGGAINYTIYTDTDDAKTVINGVPVAGTYTTSATVTNGSIPSLSTAPYIFAMAAYEITSSTQDPTISDLTFSWQSGSLLRVASAYANKRYWLSLAINSTTNNRILVYDKNQRWHPYVGINANAFLYDSQLYFANSSGVFQAETGYNDNGASITSYYRTPAYLLAGPDTQCTYHSLYMTTANSASTLGTSFQINGDGTDYDMASYAMNTDTGYQNFKLPFPMDEVHRGKYISFKWSVTGQVSWRILNGNLYYTKDLLPD